MFRTLMLMSFLIFSHNSMADTKSGFGIETGLSDFITTTTITNNKTNSVDSYTGKGSGTTISLVYHGLNNFYYKLGSTSFSTFSTDAKTIYWNPKSESITHIDLGYDHNFSKRKKFYWSAFAAVGVTNYKRKNTKFNNFATDYDSVDLEENNNNNLPNEKSASAYFSGGISANYATKKFLFSVSLTNKKLSISNNEGEYSYVPNNSSSGGYFKKVLDIKHETNIKNTLNVKVLYLFLEYITNIRHNYVHS